MLVGRIVNHHGETTFRRGDEKGKFEFGGSTIVMLFGKDSIAVVVDYPANEHSSHLYLYHVPEILGVEHCIFAAVALIYVVSFESYGIYGVELSAYIGIFAFHSVVYIAVPVIVVHLKAEYTAVSAAVALCEELVADQVGYPVA